ncbi:MAG: FHA domain-containing protein [Gemmataceae bacterium]|nr:FHA domain-containing protein [Gemmataceae bacterium]
MDSDRTPEEGLPGPRLHDPDRAGAALPEGFQPLRLLLQPGGLCIELTRSDMLVGRHSESDIRLALPDVSRRHCRFLFIGGGWQVVDLNSLNGVFVNGERLDVASLRHGDFVRIASLMFAVEIGSQIPNDNVLRSIADVLPSSTQEHRKAS